jgi:DMSO/TMAO reductase YedYZ molybdopterin-dependent catalytic subunit
LDRIACNALHRAESIRHAAAARPGEDCDCPSEFQIGGAVPTPLRVTAENLKKMPRKTLRVDNTHAKRTEVYEGVPLEVLLQKAGVPQGEQVRGPAMTSCVLVEAADDYHVIFSSAELDSSFQDSEVLMADTMDGVPLPTRARSSLLLPTRKVRHAGPEW